MKSWLRFFGLSFFSDKIAKEARNRGVLNCVLGFVLALVFTFCGVLAANCVPFYTHYKNASGFKGFIYGFADEIALTLKDGRISSQGIIDTFTNEEDAAKYGKNGYNLVIDTRASTALDDFEAYCLSKDGKEEISYGQYLGLTDEEKSGYDCKIRYTDRELKLTGELVAGYESYLKASGDEDVVKQLAQLTEDRANLSAEEYDRRVYTLYVSTYYKGLITDYERAGNVPLLRSYYYRNYIYGGKNEKCLYVFDDVLFGFFETDGGIAVTFYGSFDKMSDGILTADGADGFVKDAFASSLSLSASVYLMNIFRFIPFIAAIPLILALIANFGFILLKDDKYKKYTACLKIEFSYLAVGALISALVMFICGFFISSGILNNLPLIMLAAVMLVRTAVLLVGAYMQGKRNKSVKTSEGGTEDNEQKDGITGE